MAKSKAEPAAEPATSKMAIVRAALDELGSATPRDLQAYIQDRHGVEMSTTMISSYKSNILKKQGGAPAGRGKGDGPAGGTVPVKDVVTLLELIDRNGAAQVQALVQALAK